MPEFPAKIRAFRALFLSFLVFSRQKRQRFGVCRRHFCQAAFFVLFLPLYPVFAPILLETSPKFYNSLLLYRPKSIEQRKIFYTFSIVFYKINPFYPKNFLWTHKLSQFYSRLCIFYNSLGFISLLLVPFSRKQTIGFLEAGGKVTTWRISFLYVIKRENKRLLFPRGKQQNEKR